MPQLRDHLIGRLSANVNSGPYSNNERAQLYIYNNRIYFHQTLRVNYTTYDMRRDQDTISLGAHPDLMVLADRSEDNSEQAHPYWYARALSIFHVKARYTGPGSTSADFANIHVVWVRWFKLDLTARGGFALRRLHRIQFVSNNDDEVWPFGFLNPDDIIRGTHLIPGFAHGRTTDYLGPSLIRSENDNDEDWRSYYVNQ